MKSKANQRDVNPRRRVARASKHEPVLSQPGTPHTFPKRVLLAVAGLSPQVVTETVYALTKRLEPAFVPTEVHLLTTAEGAERARLTLLSEDPGWFHRLRRDYGLPEIRFDDETIHVLKSADGTPIADIRTREENERLADTLTEIIRNLTADETCALHLSIAGGRKTMGFYAGYALSLFGRSQDRLSHVLVNTPYESNQQFYYPTPYRHVIYTHPPENRPLDAREAEVELADIPFVRLRPGLDERLLAGSATFSEVVAAAQQVLGPAVLEIDLDGKCIHAGPHQVRLPPAQLAFVSWLARRAQKEQIVECPPDGAPDSGYAREYLFEYGHLGDDTDSLTAKGLRKGMDKAFFEQTKSRLHRILRDALGPEGPRRYGVVDDGQRPKRYRIAVPPENILWLDWAVCTGKLAKKATQP
jgi:CRISPR-associated protein (TIGR02584 family)